ncbi:ABC transporter ATP-binding protein [Niveispirillum cyanobacteriorum]|uniref:ABC transporter n=1 Tax=Niveispirillum cyanobacteriorum TaxID=1612173 RepID=A0A2K9N8U9_9PROT|nr:ABC transporter ATP-binding protein [Niveispirillum cyanobacteriorum]AUN28976.1 ABC transporter [Niveispirillum cyanobacteriorum]GGE68601.1 lipoprotein-releasing system ATP-binding protein LolD 1 [Niveispirillum cyanobacteriorum]
MAEIVLRLTGIHRSFTQVETPLHVLRGVDAAIQAGEMVALVGPSGAGKSTLLHIAGLLEAADKGGIEIAGQKADGLNDAERTAIRRDKIGFVYQFHHLLPEFTAEENITIPQMLAGVSRSVAKDRARELLGLVGLSARAGHRPAKLSGGEQQRVAIARALANRPRLLIADEPTGNLDMHTSEKVFALFADLVRGQGLGALVATHNLDLARRMDRVVEMRDGLLVAG